MRAAFYGLLTAAALGAAGCGGDRSRPSDAGPEPTAAPAAPTAVTTVAAARTAPAAQARAECRPGNRPAASETRALGAAARHRLWVYDRPNGRRTERFGKLNLNGVPTVFGVVARRVDATCRATWYRVRLPRRPNHRLGWVRAADVTVAELATRILVDLSDRRVTLFRGGRKELETTAAIGSPSTPTPTGTFYVDQRLLSGDPGGPFGPGAIGIAAYSEVLTGWAQGGPIAIHGTNRPDLIGQRVSNGCIRVRNDVLRRLFAATLAGTPVVIRP